MLKSDNVYNPYEHLLMVLFRQDPGNDSLGTKSWLKFEQKAYPGGVTKSASFLHRS